MPSSETLEYRGFVIEYMKHGDDEPIEIIDIRETNNPCFYCTRATIQAILYDEVDCYKKCETWKRWKRSLKE